METLAELLRQGRSQEVWQRCCGFVDLSLEEFMAIQERLLLEQLELLNRCPLGEKLLKGQKPRTMQQFREMAPLTTYSDYVPELMDKREDVLPAKPAMWQRTAGRSGEYPCKWAPVTEAMYDQLGPLFIGLTILSSCEERGDVRLEPNDTVLYGLAPPPYATGALVHVVDEAFPLHFMPPIPEAEKMSFQERLQQGFLLGLEHGMDYFYGISSILVATGERFSQRSGSMKLSSLLGRPRTVWRFASAMAKSKIAGQPILPRHLWKPKGMLGGGSDSRVYRSKVKALWGRYVLDVFGCTEGIALGTQTWDYDTMTFIPHLNFFEFIPEADSGRIKSEPGFRPRTLLLSEVEPGQCYEIVITNFHGGPFVRYRLGDLVRINARRNEALNIDIPQMSHESRVDGIIDVAGFTRLTEATIWQALEDSGVGYLDWAARKEIEAGEPVLRIYAELRDSESKGADEITPILQQRLSAVDTDYQDLENMLDRRPLRITILPRGAFAGYMAKRQAEGVDPAHLKPPHINPSDASLALLLVGKTV